MKIDPYTLFILSYNRPRKQKTLQYLLKNRYEGSWYIVVGTDDKSIEEYKLLYGEDRIVVFDKFDYAKRIDTGDNFNLLASVVYARHASYEIAKDLGYEYFIQCDDDIDNFQARPVKEGELLSVPIKDCSKMTDSLMELYQSEPRMITLGVGEEREYMGGVSNPALSRGYSFGAASFMLCSVGRGHYYNATFTEDGVHQVLSERCGKMIHSAVAYKLTTKDHQATGVDGMGETYASMGNGIEYNEKIRMLMANPAGRRILRSGDKFRFLMERNSARPLIVSEDLKN